MAARIRENAGRLAVAVQKALWTRRSGLGIRDVRRRLCVGEERRGQQDDPTSEPEKTLLVHKEIFLKL